MTFDECLEVTGWLGSTDMREIDYADQLTIVAAYKLFAQSIRPIYEKNTEEKTMNKVMMLGRLTKDPEVRYNNELCIARYGIAVDRRYKKDGGQDADFFNCVAFGKSAEFAEKYLQKGTKIAIEGRLQSGSYTNKDGVKVYTTDIVVEQQEFAQSKATEETEHEKAESDGFVNIPEGIDEELPFS